MKLKHIFFIPILLLLFNSSSKINEDYFEGQIVYEINYTPKNINNSNQEIKNYAGSKMIFTFKKGNYKKEYYNPEGKLLQERFLDLKKRRLYMKIHYLTDTILWFDINKNDSRVVFKKVKKDTILDYECNVIEASISLSIEGFKPYNEETIYSFANGLKIDFKWYEFFNEGRYNEIIKIGNGIALKMVHKSFEYDKSIEAISITKRKISNEELKFKISDFVLREI